MKKLFFKARTLDDEPIRDGLCAVGALEDDMSSGGQSYVVGGMAVQSYLPSVCRRPTSDIDLVVLRPLNFAEFKDFSLSAANYLCDNNYEVQTKKGHTSHQLIYSKEIEGVREAAIIEFARRNSSSFDGISDRLYREAKFIRKKIVEGRDVSYSVCSPEDIAVPKIVRSIGSLERNERLCMYVRDVKPTKVTDEDIARGIGHIKNLREEAAIHVGNLELAEEVRFISDIFDIRMLAEATGFNEYYLNVVMDSWDKINEGSAARDLLINFLFPKMDFSFRGQKISQIDERKEAE